MRDDATVIELLPEPPGAELAAALEAVSRSGVAVGFAPAAYGSAWRAAALAETVEREPGSPGCAARGAVSQGLM